MPRHLVRRLGLHLHRSRSQLHGRPHSPSRPQTFELNLIIPPSTSVETISFHDERALTHFLRACNGSLYYVDSNGKRQMMPPDHKALSPLQTYEVFSPFSMPMQNIQHYEQISDKGFEEKSRKALITYMNQEGIAFNELNRVIQDGDRVVAEWEGVFEVDGGQHLYFLECKHKMTAVSTSLSDLC